MRPKDYINKKAKEEALKAFGATQLNNNQETSPYFIGEISADRKTIKDPTGKVYKLTFSGNPQKHELAQRLSNDSAYVDARKSKQINVDGNLGGCKINFTFSPSNGSNIEDPGTVLVDMHTPNEGAYVPFDRSLLEFSTSQYTGVYGANGKFINKGKDFYNYIIGAVLPNALADFEINLIVYKDVRKNKSVTSIS